MTATITLQVIAVLTGWLTLGFGGVLILRLDWKMAFGSLHDYPRDSDWRWCILGPMAIPLAAVAVLLARS